MRLTYDTPIAMENGMPAFVGADGKMMTYPEGFKALQKKMHLTAADLAQICGVSTATVYGWRQGRPPGAAPMVKLHRHLAANSP